uniref:Variant surface glycoprotein 1125.461 n=1 Tax=Trypanosoma brucei TaxID=5691 RepID=A0A1J0R5V6_9TRYP|nr:variant surface glycoprotein 1125.461 [Trypanosoma brucei]
MSEKKRLAFVSVILLAVTRHGSGTAGLPIKNAVWTPLCTLNHKLAGYFQDRITSAGTVLTTAQNLIADRLKIQIYLEAKAKTEAVKFLPLLAHLQTIRVMSHADQTNALDKVIKATAHSHYLHGRIADFMETAADARAGSTQGCLEKTADTNVVEGSGKLPNCGIKGPVSDSENSGASKLTTANMFTDLTQNKGSATATATVSKCAYTKKDTNSLVQNQAIAGDLTFAAGYFTTSQSSDDTTNAARPTVTSATAATGPEAFQNMAKSVFVAQTAWEQPAAKYTRPTLSAIAKCGKARAAAKKHIKNSKEEYKAAEEGSAMEEIIKQTYGNKEEPDQQSTWKIIEDLDIPRVIYTADTSGLTKLREINDVDALLTILSHYAIEMKSKQELTIETLNKQLNSAKEVRFDDDCSKLERKEKCNEEKTCSWNDTAKSDEKHCKFNSTKAKANGAPATQTQTSGTETTTDKCKDKKKDECKDGCSWEGETCKDSSFLLNKKFALMASAFVILVEF